MEAQQDDSAPECDMHASMISLHSARSSRSSVTVHDAMTQSLYGKKFCMVSPNLFEAVLFSGDFRKSHCGYRNATTDGQLW